MKDRKMKDKKKIVYQCDCCHEYFEEGVRYKGTWTEVGANVPTEYYTYLCEKCFYKLRNERIKYCDDIRKRRNRKRR